MRITAWLFPPPPAPAQPKQPESKPEKVNEPIDAPQMGMQDLPF